MEVLVLSLVTNSVVIPDEYISPREEFESEVRISISNPYLLIGR